jgi:AcrR family transcriptional regulator
VGFRERKKEQTRQSIAETAWRLFAERGYDRVTVAEIARAAQVAEATVFNYFPTKEDLFYSRLEAFGDQLVEAIGPGRPASRRWPPSGGSCSNPAAGSARPEPGTAPPWTGCGRSTA